MISLNAKGLDVPEKRRMLLNDLKHLDADVAFVQETHFRVGRLSFLQNIFFPRAYHASNQEAKSKGVSILISNRVPWSLVDKCLDRNGRYPFLNGHIGGVRVTLATLYSPNLHQDSFINESPLRAYRICGR